MPAYRSQAEADIRVPVVERLRELYPGCRIIHEINASSFGNRIDVLAVSRETIAAVEIKSAKDKLDRLPDQVAAMRGVARDVYAALHEKFLEHHHYGVSPPSSIRHKVETWIWPKADRQGYIGCQEEWRGKYSYHQIKKNKVPLCLPSGALHALWREELQELCKAMSIKGAGSLSIDQAVEQLKFRLTGAQINQAVCATLRARECVEADEPIKEDLQLVLSSLRVI